MVLYADSGSLRRLTWSSYRTTPEVASTPGVQLKTGSAATSAAGAGCDGAPPPLGATESNR